MPRRAVTGVADVRTLDGRSQREVSLTRRTGVERGTFPIDSEWLVLKFDRDIVVTAKIVRD